MLGDENERKELRIKTLTFQKKTNKMKLGEKKKLAKRVMALKEDIEADILAACNKYYYTSDTQKISHGMLQGTNIHAPGTIDK